MIKEVIRRETNAPATYMCSTSDFVQATNAEDGSVLEVVDETSGAVTGYYTAFNGKWVTL